MPPTGFEPAFRASEQPQIDALDRVATATDCEQLSRKPVESLYLHGLISSRASGLQTETEYSDCT